MFFDRTGKKYWYNNALYRDLWKKLSFEAPGEALRSQSFAAYLPSCQ